jgi:phage terminase large subunit-like protein
MAKVIEIKDYDSYAIDVIAGREPACNWVVLACKRYLNDKQRKDLKFDEKEVDFIINFIQLLKQSKGEFGGQNLVLQRWQKFIIANIFGFYKKNDTGKLVRRYRKCYVEIPRKNGKSTFASAIALYMFTADKEPGPQIYFAATKKDQAKICYDEAVSMIKYNTSFSNELVIQKSSSRVLYKSERYGFMTPLSADSDKMSGFNTHLGVIDELHEHPNSQIVDLLTTSISARLQPIIFEITTAGKRLDSICYEHSKMTEEILQGIKLDDNWFGIKYSIDEGDDWTLPATWRKANPNLGVSKKWDYMYSEYQEATNRASKVNVFKQLDLNVWTFGGKGWITDEQWMDCDDRMSDEDLKDLPMWAGLDLAETRDFSALSMVFKLPDGNLYLKVKMWCPEENAIELAKQSQPFILNWANDGWIDFTDGNVTHFDKIEDDIITELSKFNCQALAFDRRYAGTMPNHLNEQGINATAYAQTASMMSQPIKEIERLVISKKIRHDGSPSMRWMMSNAKVKENQGDEVKIIRGKEGGKIDAVISSIMAVGEMMSDELKDYTKKSIYNNRDIRFI